MSKIYIDPLNLGPILIDTGDKSDHEQITHCRGEMNGFYGKKQTGEALEAARNAFRGRKHTKETKDKMRKVDKSYMRTEAYRNKMSESIRLMHEKRK